MDDFIMSHTPTPWRVAGGPRMKYIESRIGNGQIQEIASCMVCEHGDLEENARRIVACVNACDGVPTEVLESGCLLWAQWQDMPDVKTYAIRINWPATVIVLIVGLMIYLTWGVTK
jgi:hypothetical protein